MARILIVEPDQALGDVLCKYLQKKSYQVALAGSAQQAIGLADDKRPDLIVLELAIPEHNGLAFLQEFRSYTDWADIPVVVYSHIPLEDTGYSEDDWHKHGVAAYLYKPTKTLASLLYVIEQNLNNYETV